MKKKTKIVIAVIIVYCFLLLIAALVLISKGYPFGLELLRDVNKLVFTTVAFCWLVILGVKLLYNWIDFP